MRRISYLFEPARVSSLLDDLPSLRSRLGNPREEGEPSSAFPTARKSERQLYRVLTNPHYPHLAALLRSLDFCLHNGFEQPTLLRSRAREAFGSALSELASAEHFLLRGFKVEGLDVQKGTEVTPEFLAQRDGLKVAVEVYHPIEWGGLDALTAELREALKNLDVPLSFRFELRLEQLEHFTEDGTLLHLPPEALARELGPNRRTGILDTILGRLATELESGLQSFAVHAEEQDLNLRVSVAINDVRASTLPVRGGSIHGPGLSGYVPEAMFDRLVSKRVRRKAGRSQARGTEGLACLIVDLADTQVTAEFANSVYQRECVGSLRRAFGDSLPGYDLIVFSRHAGWGQELVAELVQYEDSVPESTIRVLFGNHLSNPHEASTDRESSVRR